MMKIACTGASSTVGKILVEKYGVIPLECDVRSSSEVERAINLVKPDLIAHLASKSNVDWCEPKEHWDEVIAVNYTGTRHVLQEAKKKNIGVAFLSSDHVFDGKRGKYKEDYKFISPNLFGNKYNKPVNGYGLSKLCGEVLRYSHPNMKVIRTSYLFSEERLKNDMESIYNPPTFIFRSFMYLNHFVDNLYQYLTHFSTMPTVLHLSGSKTVSWYDFSLAYASMYNLNKSRIVPRKHEIKKNGLAPRPYKCGLDTSLSKKLGFYQFDYLQGLETMRNGK
jgi:dTDP-4-dehydrorhamnose reductase